MKEVNKEEYEDHVKHYPLPLVKNVSLLVNPNLETHNDMSNLKVWPESVIACIEKGEEDKYFISDNVWGDNH